MGDYKRMVTAKEHKREKNTHIKYIKSKLELFNNQELGEIEILINEILEKKGL